MTLATLKKTLTDLLFRGGFASQAASSEILEELLKGSSDGQLAPKLVTAYEVGGTLVFLSDESVRAPKQLFFIDLCSGVSLIQSVDPA